MSIKGPSSFDIIGNREKAVAIVEIQKEMSRYRKRIAAAVMKQHKNVKTVLEKGTPRKGVYRIRDYKILAGDQNTEVVHIESGCHFLLDPKKVYFSQREGTERLRIASSVKNNETVMIFFAGVGTFPIIISKKADAEKIIGIEINPDAVDYFKKNIQMNKCLNIEIVEGDVSKKAAEYSNLCDRILMPLPEKALDYLAAALDCAKSGAFIHIYLFAAEDEVKNKKAQIRNIAKKAGKKISFVRKTNVLPYGPGIWKMRLDIKVI
ncbi:MAG: class I SAM-dependent methyltransferase family protein [Candidatus Aenigmarchaeota archaeon]|nr:class I SAM-dependent methyltransferase family protein [Candidatus Aenigmarchaeota archaeon]